MKRIYNIRFGKEDWKTSFSKGELNEFSLQKVIFYLHNGGIDSRKFTRIRKTNSGKVVNSLYTLICMRKKMSRLISKISGSILFWIT